MRKRGISPLIATVLLIGFTVIIAVSIWLWYGRIVTDQFMKQGAIAQIKSDCFSEIELQVLSVDASTGNIEIKNSGNKIFNGVRVLIDEQTPLSEKESFQPGEQKTITVTGINANSKVTVMPMIVRQGVPGTCSDKKVTYQVS
ncbi:hypothetical protein J4404_03550 [Candidatus Woesearchaeota archaeon]|nr:hypothetical protein [Candidatus Woesearchaeota archaeon]